VWKKFFKRKDESGVSLVEVIIAASIILILLVATAQAFSSAFATSVLAGNRNQAIQFAQEVASIARQAPFDQVGLVPPATRPEPLPSQCGVAYTGTFEGQPEITQTTEYPGLVYCQIREITGTDQVFVIYTHITQIPTSGFDNSSLTVDTTSTAYVPRRVTVTVSWFNKINLDASAQFDELTMSYVRTPSMAECIPPGIATNTNNPAGCSYITGYITADAATNFWTNFNIVGLIEDWYRITASSGGQK